MLSLRWGCPGGKDLEMVFSRIALNSGSHQRPSAITTARERNPGGLGNGDDAPQLAGQPPRAPQGWGPQVGPVGLQRGAQGLAGAGSQGFSRGLSRPRHIQQLDPRGSLQVWVPQRWGLPSSKMGVRPSSHVVLKAVSYAQVPTHPRPNSPLESIPRSILPPPTLSSHPLPPL